MVRILLECFLVVNMFVITKLHLLKINTNQTPYQIGIQMSLTYAALGLPFWNKIDSVKSNRQLQWLSLFRVYKICLIVYKDFLFCKDFTSFSIFKCKFVDRTKSILPVNFYFVHFFPLSQVGCNSRYLLHCLWL